MDATLKNALAQPSVMLFGALKAELPGYSLRLLDGSGSITINGEVYEGFDERFGTIGAISELTEEIGDSAPEITIMLNPPDASSAASLASPNMQGCKVVLMVGAIDPESGAAIGTPEVLFMGEVDVPTLGVDQSGSRTVEFSVVSVFERLFEVEEGQRASHGWHQSIWPDEYGLEHMTGTDVNLYWGAKPPQDVKQIKGWPGLQGLTQSNKVSNLW